MPRDYKLYLRDIVEAAQKIETYTRDLSREQFGEDPLRIDAVLLNLVVIGEAVRSIPEAFRQEHDSVEWRQIVALRNRIAHEYFGVNINIIWSIIKDDLPALKRQVSDLLEDMENT